jgi:hypothetical protein
LFFDKKELSKPGPFEYSPRVGLVKEKTLVWGIGTS